MDTIHTKYVSQLVNAHKIAAMLVPLIEAVEINKRTQGARPVTPSDLLKHVVEVGGELYQGLLDKNEQLVDMGLIPDKLFLTLSKSLRNSIVLYNSPSLSLMKDEIASLFDENIEFIQRYQNSALRDVNTSSNTPAALYEQKRARQEAIGYAAGALSQLFMPLWLFHTNLYTSGYIDEERVADLNKASSGYLVVFMNTILERMNVSQGDYAAEFRMSSIYLCSDMISNCVYDFHKKLIKNKSELDAYIEDPAKTLAKIVPAVYSSFNVMNSAAEGILANMFKTA
jgi:hypothetical protein